MKSVKYPVYVDRILFGVSAVGSYIHWLTDVHIRQQVWVGVVDNEIIEGAAHEETKDE